MITLTAEEAEKVLRVVNLYWDECDYQIDECGGTDPEGLAEWEADNELCKEVSEFLTEKIP